MLIFWPEFWPGGGGEIRLGKNREEISTSTSKKMK